MLRSTILAAARNRRIEHLVTAAPVSRSVVRRFVGGADTADAVHTSRKLVEDGLHVTLDHLGEDTTDREHAESVVAAYRELLADLHRANLTGRPPPLPARTEVSVKDSTIGHTSGADGEKNALDHAREICTAAEQVGATVTLDKEDH